MPLWQRAGPAQASIALPAPLPGEQPAVGNAQLPLESGHVFVQLLSSLDPLENSASLSVLGGVLVVGSCLGHLGLWSLPVPMESLDFGLGCLWCLCVQPGSGRPAAGPVQGILERHALRGPESVPGLLWGCALAKAELGFKPWVSGSEQVPFLLC